MLTDSEIIALFEARDERAISETVAAYGKLCEHHARRILGSREDAEEICNDVLLRLWNAIPPAHPRSLPAFLTSLTRNACFDRYEKRTAAKRGGGQLEAAAEELSPFLAAEGTPEDIISEIALRDALTRFLDALPKEQRMVFLARYYAMQPIAEIAKKHGCTQGKIKMMLRRVKTKLREYLIKEELL